MVTELVDYVVGVDTHRDEHTLALVEAATGAVLAQRAVTANARGYAQALRFAQQHADAARVWALEGAGHYGAGLARYLSERGEAVLEVGRSSRGERRLRGKDDQLDAVRAARAALSDEPLPRPRSGEHREALRLLLLARRSAVDVRREALVQLRSVIVTAPGRLREELRGLPVGRLLERCSRLRRPRSTTPDERAARLVLRTLARRIEAATVEAAELEREIFAHVRALARRGCSTSRASARSSPPSCSSPGHIQAVSVPRLPLPASPASHRSRPRVARRLGSGSAAAATASSTAPCTRSCSTAASTTRRPGITSRAGSPRARAAARPPAC
jgi:Transposase